MCFLLIHISATLLALTCQPCLFKRHHHAPVPRPTCAGREPRARAAGFANEAQFLLASEASLAEVGARLAPAAGSAGPRRAARGLPAPLDMMRFRPNLVVGGAGLAPFAEDAWRGLQLGAACFRVAGAARPL